MRDKQRNKKSGAVPNPETQGVDEFLWRGSRNATRFMRMGGFLFAVIFLLIGASFLYSAITRHSGVEFIYGSLCAVIGTRIFFKTQRKER